MTSPKNLLSQLFEFRIAKQVSTMLTLIVLLVSSIEGQLNIKIGYSLDYSKYSINNAILNSYNESFPSLTQSFRDVHFSNGLQLGLRVKSQYLAIDANWERVSNEKTAKGINGSGAFSSNLDYTLNRYAIGLEAYPAYFGIGTNVYYQQISISSIDNDSDFKEKILKDGDFGSKVYLIFSVPGTNLMSFSLQPYVMIPWTATNYFDLNNHLNQPSALTTFNQRNIHLGLSLIFYNGPQ